jgi:hypothetical protein
MWAGTRIWGPCRIWQTVRLGPPLDVRLPQTTSLDGVLGDVEMRDGPSTRARWERDS